MSSNHSDWLGRRRLIGRITPQMMADRATRKRMHDAEAKVTRLGKVAQALAVDKAKVEAEKRNLEARTFKARMGKVGGAIRRIFSRGKV